MRPPICHVYFMINIQISFDHNIIAKYLLNIPWYHFLCIWVEIFLLVQISSINLKKISYISSYIGSYIALPGSLPKFFYKYPNIR